MSAVLIVAILVAVAVAFIAVMDWVRKRRLSYRFDERALSIVVVGPFHPRPILYWDIADVTIVSLLDFVLDSRFGGFRDRS